MADEVKIENIRDAITIIENTLLEEVKKLDQRDQVIVERAITIDEYDPKHVRGGIGILYSGSTYEKTTRGPSLLMKRIIRIGLLVSIRFIDNPNNKTESFTSMMPAEYVDFIVDACSGIKIFNHLPENENKTYPVADEIVSEKDYKWKYLVTIGVPVDYVERSLRKNL